jgi:hypothetical protein
MKRAKPTERITLPVIEQDAPIAEHVAQTEQVVEFARSLVEQGKDPIFEVWFPGTTAEDFDVLRYDPESGALATVPPYSDEPYWSEEI